MTNKAIRWWWLELFAGGEVTVLIGGGASGKGEFTARLVALVARLDLGCRAIDETQSDRDATTGEPTTLKGGA